MARTPLATRTYDTSQKGPRVPNVTPSFIVIHHAATLDFDAVINLELGAREVSSTVIIKDGQVASMFDEQYRAWSLSSQYWDSVSLSSETCNETTAPGWTISEASYQTLAKVVADWCQRYGIACNRTQILGHREVYTRYGASYATACPGGIDLDRVVSDAATILAGGSPAKSKETIVMELATYQHRPSGGRPMAPGVRLRMLQGSTNAGQNIARGPGDAYSFSVTFHGSGFAEGDTVEMHLVWSIKGKPESNWESVIMVADRNGDIQDTKEFKHGVASEYAVFVDVTGGKDNKNTGKLDRLDTDSYHFATA